ncbi:Interphotoreceptor retinol-binding [Penicillium maclennaniae]|uniref:Interphotoreceptor retinol-binding n=1 Tax=Penicillium maclennaniae TaxID=1343394 RepID=UPI0025413A23|nr:Interphotoreceptor retinol-binding [Penicillium maclennaniae]KAJ5670657.1 Interphotoreceptor retinol-binding [Penicillium maclennaniae]
MHFTPLLIPLAAATGAIQVRHVEPCAQITNLVSDVSHSQIGAKIPHDLVHQCLMSMPFDSGRAVTFLTQVRRILEFQSTIDILKQPPSGYQMPPTDLLRGIETIQDKVNSNGYSSQFEMDLEVSHLIKSAYDGHLSFQLCSQSIFRYGVDMPLVSISTDGLSPPQVYTLSDAQLQQKGADNVSPLETINGTVVAEYLESYASLQSLQDRDAQYNRIFPSLARSVTNSPTNANGIWYTTSDWIDGSELNLRYKNGTMQTVERTATPSERYFSYQNGTELYTVNCLPRSLPTASSSSSGAEQASEITGLPDTEWRNSDNSIAGYFSNLTGLENTGIMFLPTFSSSPKQTAQIATDFLQNATAAGKKNILIDLASNPGGYMSIGIDMSRIFFPDAFPYTATRYRAHDAAKYLTQAYSRDTKLDSNNVFAYRQMVQPDQTAGFSSWQDLYGPHEVLNSPSSSLLANFNYTATSTNVYPINGYGPAPLNPSRTLFPAENITIITDGDCVSTCAFFVKLMKRQGVRTITFGGRPSQAPMQGVGGVKGGQSLGINYINGYITQANQLIQQSANSSTPLLTSAEWKEFNESSPSLAPSFAWSGSVNLRNEYDPDDDQTPLQFIYEAAECRLFYTLDNYLQRETVWQAAAKSMFGNGGCVKGSTGGEGSLNS